MEEAQITRIPPNSVDAEMSVIGSMIMDREAISIASEVLTEADFYNKSYGLIFTAMVELFREEKAVDTITLSDRLKQKNAPESVANLEFIGQLLMLVPTSANIKEYVKIVKDKAILRNVIKVTEDIEKKCYSGAGTTDEVLADTEKRIFDLVQRRGGDDAITPIKAVAHEAVDRVQAASKSNGTVTGIATGYYDLDYKMAGLQKSDLILIAARPSMGKTAFVLNIAQHVIKNKVPTVIFSLEMSKVQLFNRLMSMESGVSSQSIRVGQLSDSEWEKLILSAGELGNSTLFIDDTPGISIGELRSKCRRLKLEHGLGLVIIDYLQLMTGNGKSDSRQQEISEISRSLKALAREIDAPVIALSQLSRAVEQRPDHRPMLSDLRESGAIEQDADVVMFIYRDDYYNKDTDKKGISEIIIAKQRNGPIGTVELAWLPDLTKFANLSRQ